MYMQFKYGDLRNSPKQFRALCYLVPELFPGTSKSSRTTCKHEGLVAHAGSMRIVRNDMMKLFLSCKFFF